MQMDRKHLIETNAYAMWQRMDLRPVRDQPE
jgi:hypothetical protein